MNKKLFWTGLGFQIFQLSLLGILFLSSIDITKELLCGVVFVLLNVVSLVFILLGAVKEDCKEVKEK